jgi:hypothetical protein
MSDQKVVEAIAKKPFGEISNIPPSSRNLPDIKTAKPAIFPDKTEPPNKDSIP